MGKYLPLFLFFFCFSFSFLPFEDEDGICPNMFNSKKLSVWAPLSQREQSYFPWLYSKLKNKFEQWHFLHYLLSPLSLTRTVVDSRFQNALNLRGNVKSIYVLFTIHFIFGYEGISKMVYVLKSSLHVIMLGFAL